MEKFLKISNPAEYAGFTLVNIGLVMDCRMAGSTGVVMKFHNKSGSAQLSFSSRTADVTGTTTTFAPSPNGSNLLIDSSATFITDGVKKGDVVQLSSPFGLLYPTVVSVDSETQITLADYNIDTAAQSYGIYSDYNEPVRFIQNAIADALSSKWTEPIYEVNNFPFTLS